MSLAPTSTTFTPPDFCWRSLGTWGNRSCPRLPSEIHCHNCAVYIQSGRHQLEQPSSEEYRRQWTDLLARPKETETPDTHSVVILRLGTHTVALSTTVFKRIYEPRPIHPIPHRSNALLLGLVALQGELHLAFSLTELLRLKADESFTSGRKRTLPRMALLEKAGERWVFPVDEILGLHLVDANATIRIPADENDPSTTFLTSMFELDEHIIHCIDEELLFASLKRSLQ